MFCFQQQPLKSKPTETEHKKDDVKTWFIAYIIATRKITRCNQSNFCTAIPYLTYVLTELFYVFIKLS